MPQIVSAFISPHPPIILPSIGSEKDRLKVKKTINNLEMLGKKLKEKDPDEILISSPHLDWGFNVPLFFLARDFKNKITTYLIGSKEPQFYFQEGKKAFQQLKEKNSYSLIASGDMSHCLKKEGPYGFNEQGPKFDQALIDYLKNKDIENFLKLDDYFPEAAECGLRSFSFMLGMLEAAKIDWQFNLLSYEAPFGVGYLAAEFKL